MLNIKSSANRMSSRNEEKPSNRSEDIQLIKKKVNEIAHFS